MIILLLLEGTIRSVPKIHSLDFDSNETTQHGNGVPGLLENRSGVLASAAVITFKERKVFPSEYTAGAVQLRA